MSPSPRRESPPQRKANPREEFPSISVATEQARQSNPHLHSCQPRHHHRKTNKTLLLFRYHTPHGATFHLLTATIIPHRRADTTRRPGSYPNKTDRTQRREPVMTRGEAGHTNLNVPIMRAELTRSLWNSHQLLCTSLTLNERRRANTTRARSSPCTRATFEHLIYRHAPFRQRCECVSPPKLPVIFGP